MNQKFYTTLIKTALSGKTLSPADCRTILTSPEIDLLSLIHAAFEIRKKYHGKKVTLHIIDNVQNGHCTQDCQYCAQSKNSKAPIQAYPMKSDEQIMAEAQEAFESGAFRHCLVFSGPSQSLRQIEHLIEIIKEMKSRFPTMEVCVSPGFINEEQAKRLKAAGLNRLNHNLNTSRHHYPAICSTHTFEERLKTLQAAKAANLQICSGVIIGMGETADDIIDIAMTMRKIRPDSLPVNFFLPIDGLPLSANGELTPEFCLRVLCLFRFLNPETELRVAAGREIYFRDLEVMCLYPANSIFINGYLNVQGSSRAKTFRMIRDAGFTVECEHGIDELLEKEEMENDDRRIVINRSPRHRTATTPACDR